MHAMNLYEQDVKRDGGIDFETDDEENQADTNFDDDDDDDTDDDDTGDDSKEYGNTVPPWPQSYKKSMDMFSNSPPPPMGVFLNGGENNSSNSFTYKRPTCVVAADSPLSKPLLLPSESNLDERTYSRQRIESPQCSFAQATFNTTNVLCGIGLLTTPYAIKEGGWSTILLLFILGIITCYTGVLIKRCLESSPGLHTYPDIGHAAFGKTGRLIIAVILYLDLYASCVEYTIMMGDNLSALFPHAHMSFSGISISPSQTFAIITTLVILPTCWLRDLSLLSYLSAGGVFTSVMVGFCLLWVGVENEIGFHPTGVAFDLANLPVTLGIVGFCYSGHTVFPNIYSSMKKPSQFPLVLIVSFGICWFMYTSVAICGFLMFGESTKSQFTLNMPKQFFASNMAVWTSVLNPLSKFALTITPVALSLEELLPADQLKARSTSILIRTILVLSNLLVALTVPFFGLVMALIGSLFAMLVALVFPCACYLSILRGTLSKFQILACVAIIVLGVISSCAGTYSAIAGISNHITN